MDLFYGRIIPYLIAGLFILILGVAVWIARRALRLEQDLLGLNRNLENCVAERTREIVAANEQLALKNEAVSALNEELTAQNEEIIPIGMARLAGITFVADRFRHEAAIDAIGRVVTV